MQQSSIAMQATGGREASRAHRMRLAQGKTALPPPAERTRTGVRAAAIVPVAPVSPAPQPAAAVKLPAPVSVSANVSRGNGFGGRAASLARRAALVQGKAGLQRLKQAAPATAPAVSETPAADVPPAVAESSRRVAQAVRAARARNGHGDAAPARPSGRMRNPKPIEYPPKVADTRTYAGQKVTGVRIGRGMNVTGDEPGAALPVTGTQYIGTESGYAPRAGGGKVGAARTAGGLVVTGTQVRSTVKITGDESNPALRITGEADQEIEDDLVQRPEQGAYVGAQFQRMHDPHGHSVFGINLGRSIKSIGSRSRDRARAIEQTTGGLPISGTAVGRSVRVTGDEPGSCRSITGDQYLMPAAKQSLCENPGAARARAGAVMAMNGRPDPVTGEKVTVSETWTRQRITGVNVEHNGHVTGDEPGVCATITGTPYVGPGQYEAYCEPGDARDATRSVAPGMGAGNRVTGDTPLNVERVTGTQHGGERTITGTPYYRKDVEPKTKENAIAHVNSRFSVRSPQREAHLRVNPAAVEASSAEARITGTFTAGEGKITGNQEFHFRPRGRDEGRPRITGEGRMEGPNVTGGAWDLKANVTGTEGYIAAERNPSERAGQPHAFAGAGLFKGKGKHEPPTRHVTGMVGWSAKSAARVTLSGGAQG